MIQALGRGCRDYQKSCEGTLIAESAYMTYNYPLSGDAPSLLDVMKKKHDSSDLNLQMKSLFVSANNHYGIVCPTKRMADDIKKILNRILNSPNEPIYFNFENASSV